MSEEIPDQPPTGGGGGSGTVTSVSVTTANGVSGSVANATTTPALSLVLGDIVPTSIGVGTGVTALATKFQVADNSATTPRGLMSSQHSDDTGSAHLHMRKSRGTIASPTVVVTGDILGRAVFSGYDGTNYLETGSIRVTSTGTIAATRVPTLMEFMTGTDAAPSVLTTALTLSAAQLATFANNIVLGATSGTCAITGGAGNMTITAGTGNSRTLALQTTTSGGTATTFLTGDASQNTTLAGNLTLGASTSSITGAAGNMTILSGTGNSRTLIVRTTTSGGVSTIAATFGADQSLTVVGDIFTSSTGRLVGASAAVVQTLLGPTYNGTPTVGLYSPSDGILRLNDSGGSSFNRLTFGGLSSSYPALKRSSATLVVRLADDSANAAITAATLTTDAPTTGTAAAWKVGVAVTGQTLTADLTKYLQVDVAGTLYKVLTAN